MYWVALLLFVVSVLIPQVITHSIITLQEDEVESVLLIIVSGALFLLFLWRERMFRTKSDVHRQAYQEAHNATQDLEHSYKYIGTINRKVDIIERVISLVTQAQYDDYAHTRRQLLTLVSTIATPANANNSMQCSIVYIDVTQYKILSIDGRRVRLSADRIKEIVQYTTAKKYTRTHRIFPSLVTREDIRAFIITPSGSNTQDDDWLMCIMATHALQIAPRR